MKSTGMAGSSSNNCIP